MRLRKVIGANQCQAWEQEIETRDLAIKVEKNADPTATEKLNCLLRMVWKTLPNDFRGDPKLTAEPKLTVERPGIYSTYLVSTHVTDAQVPGMVRLTGLLVSNGRSIKLYTRFISKPFWQYVPHRQTSKV